MSDRKEVINKIKKLLALSNNNNNENEKLAAALKAQKLISEFNIEEYELADSAYKEPIETVVSSVNNARAWYKHLLKVVAVNFRCKDFIRGKKAAFCGYKHDAEAAALVFDYLYKFANAKARRLSKDYCPPAGAYNSYTLGFVDGVKSELEKQSIALMIVVPKSVEDEFLELKKNFQKSRHRSLSWDGIGIYDAHELSSKGYEEGKEAVRARRVNAPCEKTEEQYLLA